MVQAAAWFAHWSLCCAASCCAARQIACVQHASHHVFVLGCVQSTRRIIRLGVQPHDVGRGVGGYTRSSRLRMEAEAHKQKSRNVPHAGPCLRQSMPLQKPQLGGLKRTCALSPLRTAHCAHCALRILHCALRQGDSKTVRVCAVRCGALCFYSVGHSIPSLVTRSLHGARRAVPWRWTRE